MDRFDKWVLACACVLVLVLAVCVNESDKRKRLECLQDAAAAPVGAQRIVDFKFAQPYLDSGRWRVVTISDWYRNTKVVLVCEELPAERIGDEEK